jgi:hypothetical protein
MMGTEKVATVRDNVIFELGLFMGLMGTGRAMWLSPASNRPQIATDLGGLVHLEFEEPDLTDADAIKKALAEARDRIRGQVAALGYRGNVVQMKQALCLASSQYSQARFQADLEYIHNFYSKEEVTSEQGVTADRFVDYFGPGRHWDIVHLGLFVDKENQNMLFDSSKGGDREALRAQAIEGMIKDCGAALVVIITCDSLKFGEQLARFTNVIAGHQAIAPSAAISWAKIFYRGLANGLPLSTSFEKAQDAADPGLVLLARRDIRFIRQSKA